MSADTTDPNSPDGDVPDEGDARHEDAVRLVEAVLFSSVQPVPEADLQARLPDDVSVITVLEDLQVHYGGRGVNLMNVAGGWAFRTAPDLGARLQQIVPVPRKLSRAALETLAIIAYHQPVTRGEIESIRGVAVSKGTIDVLMEVGWVRPGRRRESPGRPLTWITAPAFLDHFGLAATSDLPGLGDLRAAGLLDPSEAGGDGPTEPTESSDPSGGETDAPDPDTV